MDFYKIGELKLGIGKGQKAENDYTLHWYGSKKFTDLDLFNKLCDNINTKDDCKKFITLFNNSPFIKIEKTCINTTVTDKKKVVNYVNNADLTDNLKLCLISMIFRCDIDNISYGCPPWNGCIRHYIQVLMVFGYKFDIKKWKMEKLKGDITNDDIYSAGHPGNEYSVTKEDFMLKYKTITSL